MEQKGKNNLWQMKIGNSDLKYIYILYAYVEKTIIDKQRDYEMYSS